MKRDNFYTLETMLKIVKTAIVKLWDTAEERWSSLITESDKKKSRIKEIKEYFFPVFVHIN